jgi:transketolase
VLVGSGRDCLRVVAQQNRTAFPVAPGGFHVLRTGSRGAVLAVGPMLDRVLEAVAGLDVSVLYASTVRPFDGRGLRAALARPDVVLVEPYLAGTSARLVDDALTRSGRHGLRASIGGFLHAAA